MHKIILLFFICVSLLYAQRRIGIQISPHSKGVMVEGVYSHTPATQVVDCDRGVVYSLAQGDIILSIEGEVVNDVSVFIDKVKYGPPVLFLKVWDASASVVRSTAVPLGSEAEMAAYLNNSYSKGSKAQYSSQTRNSQPKQSVNLDELRTWVESERGWLSSQGINPDNPPVYNSGSANGYMDESSNNSSDCYSNQIYWARKKVKICRDGLSNAQSARSYVVQGTAGSWQVKLDDAEKALAELELKRQACQSGRNR
jgi:hypothetical protein